MKPFFCIPRYQIFFLCKKFLEPDFQGFVTTGLITKPSVVLVLKPLTTDSEKSEQMGFGNLLIGLFGTVSNPLAHAPKTNWLMSEQDVLDILTLVSLIHRKLDGTQKAAVASL